MIRSLSLSLAFGAAFSPFFSGLLNDIWGKLSPLADLKAHNQSSMKSPSCDRFKTRNQKAFSNLHPTHVLGLCRTFRPSLVLPCFTNHLFSAKALLKHLSQFADRLLNALHGFGSGAMIAWLASEKKTNGQWPSGPLALLHGHGSSATRFWVIGISGGHMPRKFLQRSFQAPTTEKKKRRRVENFTVLSWTAKISTGTADFLLSRQKKGKPFL